ncbi:sulfurtransferase [Candidatus Pelagibacter communis]|uniref:sulfurtransferase n=1 Tax=Pelagibacter ubique TaxID=198252 RepID=UPI00094CF88B|nr:sulfurtransferase [Candidatus Pelagibacter ubique]
MSLIETNELEKNFHDFKIIDCSWHMPLTNRNGYEEYKNKHIPNSIFFDLDKNSNKKTDLPHMLVELNEWEKIVSEMGINNNDQIVIYDNSDVISSCRCWYNFIYYGHKPDLVKVLNGGLKKWINENRITCTELPHIKKKNYIAKEIRNLLKDKKEIDENISKKNFKVIDARSIERFRGEVKEPRKGLRSGNIKNSICIPFNVLINDDKTFKSRKELIEIFSKDLKDISSDSVVFTCGSGVTACVLALAYSLINDKYLPKIYDGSWAEYGKF